MNQTRNKLQSLAAYVSRETGILFEGEPFADSTNNSGIRIFPSGENQRHSFSVTVLLKWREIVLAFKPGIFASELVTAMSAVDSEKRERFIFLLSEARRQGAEITLEPNGIKADFSDTDIWNDHWKTLVFEMGKEDLSIGEDNEVEAAEIFSWVSVFFAALLSIMSLKEVGFEEGSKISVEVTRYERDKRNRSCAVAIHGHRCKACGLEFASKYGPNAAGCIEIHHLIPVSQLGPGYVIDPKTDLVPLCANCHRVAHMREPPYTIEEIIEMLAENDSS